MQLDILKKHLFSWNKFLFNLFVIKRTIPIFGFFIFVVYLGKKDRFLAFFTDLICKHEGAVGPSMGHSNLKSENSAYSSFLSLVDVRNCVWSTVSNILIICILQSRPQSNFKKRCFFVFLL